MRVLFSKDPELKIFIFDLNHFQRETAKALSNVVGYNQTEPKILILENFIQITPSDTSNIDDYIKQLQMIRNLIDQIIGAIGIEGC